MYTCPRFVGDNKTITIFVPTKMNGGGGVAEKCHNVGVKMPWNVYKIICDWTGSHMPMDDSIINAVA